MAYGATFHKSTRAARRTTGRRSPTRRRTARGSTRSSARYPPDQRRSAVLPALYLAQDQQGYITANAMRHVAELLGITPRRRRGRRVVLHDVLHASRSGSSCCRSAGRCRARCNGAERVTEELQAKLGHQAGRDRPERHVHADRSRVPRRLRSRAGRDGQRRLARVPGARGRPAKLRRRPARARRSGASAAAIMSSRENRAES